MQLAISKRENESPEILQITYRIGINLGDIIIEGEDVFGDGVNIAARLQGLARPGGVCISGKVFDEVRNNIDVAFENQGEKQVKNIKKPVQIYQWVDKNFDAALRTTIDKQIFTIPDRPSIAVLPFDNMPDSPYGLQKRCPSARFK
jgi:adenylate cyclase